MTVSDMCIREMSKAEIPFVEAAEAKCFVTPWREKELKKTLLQGQTQFWVAFLAGEPVGYISRALSFEIVDILTLYVSPENRRMGIAEALLAKVETEVKEKGAERLMLEVRLSNIPARALYEKCGFSPLNVRRNYYTAPTEDGLVMQKEI